MSARKAGAPRLLTAAARLVPAVLLTAALTGALLLFFSYTPSTAALLGVSALWTVVFSLLFTDRRTLLIGGLGLVTVLALGLLLAFGRIAEAFRSPDSLTLLLLALPTALAVTALSRRRILLPPLVILTLGVFLIPVLLHLKPTLTQALFAGIALVVFTALSALNRWSSVSTPASESRLALWIIPAAALLAALALALVSIGTTLPKSPYLAEKFEYLSALLDELTGSSDPRTGFALTQTGMQPDDAVIGGPAVPDDTPMLTVVSDDVNVLLRGSVYRDYNGRSWGNVEAVNRYRLGDDTRKEVFDTQKPESGDLSLTEVHVTVSHTADGPASLFVPFRVDALKPSEVMTMLLYFNDRGEVFSTEDIPAGRSYTVSAMLPEADLKALADWMRAHPEPEDAGYTRAMLDFRGLPVSVPSDVRALAQSLAAEADTDAGKVLAIAEYLAQHTEYDMDVVPVPVGREITQYFLETGRGYCTYYATAMTVLARAAGVPARYVEGYHLPQDAEAGKAVSVTGEDSHAWTEVYLRGIGWVPVDVSPDNEDYRRTEPEPTPTPTPSPTPTPTPTPTPPKDAPTPTPGPQTKHSKPFPWKVILLVLAVPALVLLALFLPKAILSAKERRACRTPEGAVLYYRDRALKLLAVLDLAPSPGETPRAFAARIDREIPLRRASAAAVAEVLEKLSYTPVREAAEEDVLPVRQYAQRLDRWILSEKGRRFYLFKVTLRP